VDHLTSELLRRG